jgi:hypothetical protein
MEDRNREINRLYEAGYSTPEIARQYGISPERVRQILLGGSPQAGRGLRVTRPKQRRWSDTQYRRWFRACAVAAWRGLVRRHGTKRRYNMGCRCDLCLAANAAYQRAYYARKRAADS